MKALAAALLLTAGFLAPHAVGSESALETLSELRWESRVIAVLASRDADRDVATLRQTADQITERDIVWFVVGEDGVTTNYPGLLDPGFVHELNQRLSSEGAVVLIGKDGGVKWTAERLDLPEIFARVDSMPMRRREALDR